MNFDAFTSLIENKENDTTVYCNYHDTVKIFHCLQEITVGGHAFSSRIRHKRDKWSTVDVRRRKIVRVRKID